MVLGQNWKFYRLRLRQITNRKRGLPLLQKCLAFLCPNLGSHFCISAEIMSKNNLLDGNWVLANFSASSSASYCPRARNKHQNWKLIFCLFVILTIKWLNISNRHRTTPYLLWSYLDLFSVLYTSLLWTCLKYLSFHNRFTGNVCGKLRKKKYFFLPSLSQCLVQYHPWQHLHHLHIFSWQWTKI